MSDAFSASVEMLDDCASNVKPALPSWDKPTGSCCISLFYTFWFPFAKLLLSIFVFSQEVFIYGFFMMPLFGFGFRVMLASQNELALFFRKGFCRIGTNFFF